MAYKIDHGEFIEVNGDRQSLRYRAAAEGLPVILFLHGGPGVCDRHLVLGAHSAMAERYTMVCWDQRGSGKSYNKQIRKSDISLDTYVEDAEFVLEYLAGKFGVRRVIVSGHSWGTAIGTALAAKRPDLVAAYIGQGQFVNGAENERVSYEFCLAQARERGDKKALKILESGAPVDGVYPDRRSMMTQRDCLSRYGGAIYRGKQGLVKGLLMPLLKTKEYTLADIVKYAQGATYLSDVMWSDVVGQRLSAIKRLDVPVVITQGRHDYNTPSAIAQEWFEALEAPSKTWVWFEDSAHSPDVEEPEKWSAVLSTELSKLSERN